MINIGLVVIVNTGGNYYSFEYSFQTTPWHEQGRLVIVVIYISWKFDENKIILSLQHIYIPQLW